MTGTITLDGDLELEETTDAGGNAVWQVVDGDGNARGVVVGSLTLGGEDAISSWGSGLSVTDGALDAADTNTQAVSPAANGSTTLSNGAATVDTGVAVDATRYWDVWLSPPANADVAASLENDGTNYVIHIEENSTSVGNPTVGWQFVRSELGGGSS